MNGPPRKTGVHADARYERHDTGPWHPESATRYRAVRAALDELPDDRFIRLPGRTATMAEVLLAHDAWYHDAVYYDVEHFREQLRTGDTAVCIESYEVALEACGAMLAAADAVMRGVVDSAFCAVRPPGHHATATRGMGFCVFNHVAVTARYLQKIHGLRRIAIIDWDVHHGNGTEEIFLSDPDVLYVSLHERDIYPFTGQTSMRGVGPGEGATLNIPLPHASDGTLVLAEWDARITPAIDAFQPDFLLVSAGFDAREHDPIGGLRWTDETFAAMTRRAVAHAAKWSSGRLLTMLEGGYNPPGLAAAVTAHVLALAEAPGGDDVAK